MVSSIIVHDANSSSQNSYPFYPDLPENTLSSCDIEGLHYELRTSDIGLQVPYHLSLVQKNGDYKILVNSTQYKILPITYNLSIALVDLYGEYVLTNFKLKIVS